MGKKEELTELDNLVRSQMIKILKTGNTELLSDLSTPISYLAKNNVVAEKDTVDEAQEEAKRKLEEANKRRAGGK